MKFILISILTFYSSLIYAQIKSEKFDTLVRTELSDTLQSIYESFLNNNVEKVSIALLEKKYSHSEYYHFLKTKKIYQSRKKWIKKHSHEESIIRIGKYYPFKHIDSMIFESEFDGIDREFIKSEMFLDSAEIKFALNEMFNGVENNIIDMCYNPRHAVLFYNAEGKVSGIYEICFECSNVKVGIVGIIMFPKNSPYLRELFEKHANEL